MTNLNITMLSEKLLAYGAKIGPSLLWALLVLFVGWKLISYTVVLTQKAFEKVNLDESLESFVVSMVSVGLKVILIITVAGMLGLETTTLITMLGAMAFAVGMALQGSLANFAGGVLILVFKPFAVGDTIEAQGHKGKVTSIQIFQTILQTTDNKQIIIPNGNLSNGSITNYTSLGTRRLDMVFGIGYEDDIDKAKALISKLLMEDKRVLKDKNVQVVVGNLGDSTIDIFARAWVSANDYFAVKFDMNEKVKAIFDKEGINIPYPQMDVHVSNSQ